MKFFVKEEDLYYSISDKKRHLVTLTGKDEATRFEDRTSAVRAIEENGGLESGARLVRICLRHKKTVTALAQSDGVLDRKRIHELADVAMTRGCERLFGFLTVFTGLVVEDFEVKLNTAEHRSQETEKENKELRARIVELDERLKRAGSSA